MTFWNPYGLENLILVGNGLSGAASNGTAFIEVAGGARLGFAFPGGGHFGLLSLDLAGANVAFPSVAVQVIGYGDMGLAVTNTLTIDSLAERRANSLPDFQTFALDSRFHDLFRVDIIGYPFSMDNVLIGGVPEPSVGALVLLGTLSAFGRLRINRRRRRD